MTTIVSGSHPPDTFILFSQIFFYTIIEIIYPFIIHLLINWIIYLF